MTSGTISFARLFDYIRRHPDIPHKDEPSFQGFKDIYLQLVRNIPELPGWYAWIRHTAAANEIIYIGQSQSRKTASLKARIQEEFLDEFVALWATIWNPEEMVEQLDQKYRGKYTTPIKRAARKAGASHLVWFGQPSLTDAELDFVEHSLIAKYNPPANKQSRSHGSGDQALISNADATLQREMAKIAD